MNRRERRNLARALRPQVDRHLKDVKGVVRRHNRRRLAWAVAMERANEMARENGSPTEGGTE